MQMIYRYDTYNDEIGNENEINCIRATSRMLWIELKKKKKKRNVWNLERHHITIEQVKLIKERKKKIL